MRSNSFSVTHSTIDCVALAIRTPVGVVISHRRFQNGPDADRRPARSICTRFARYGQEGVLALFSDSTNVERPGYTPSERAVRPRIEELSRAAPRKVIVSCFACSIPRIQQVSISPPPRAARVGFVGRSMVDNVEIAHGMNRLRIPDGMVVRPQDIKSFDPQKTRGSGERQPGRAHVFPFAHRRGQSPPADAR